AEPQRTACSSALAGRSRATSCASSRSSRRAIPFRGRFSEAERGRRSHDMSKSAALALAAAVCVLAAGCGGGGGADKAGGSRPVTLTMADGYDPDLTLEPAVAFFVRRAQELSNGKLRIKVGDNWAGKR